MKKIIQGFGETIQLEGAYNPTSWDVRVFEVNGHREISARNSIDWEEVPYQPVLDQFPDTPSLQQLEEAEERRLAALKRNAKRAQTMCRRVIKSEGFNEMLTLTYRQNQGDRALCKRHFAEWMRRMKRALGEFRFCASFERQERGAMHIHIATHALPQFGKFGGEKIKSWQLGTKIWRSVVGADNGMCFVGGRNKNGRKRTKKLSLARMAQYVSKYIMKDYQDAPEESQRYTRSRGGNVPKPKSMHFTGMSMADIIALCFECADGDVIVSHRADTNSRSYWLCTEPDPDRLDSATK
jgi:hypothetical protein